MFLQYRLFCDMLLVYHTERDRLCVTIFSVEGECG